MFSSKFLFAVLLSLCAVTALAQTSVIPIMVSQAVAGIVGALLLEDNSSILLLEDNSSNLCLEGNC